MRDRISEEIFREKQSDKHGSLRWGSIGQPKLVWNWKNNSDSMYSRDEYFAFSLDMLSESDRLELQKEVLQTKGVKISTKAFANLRPDDLSCKINIYDWRSKHLITLRGT